MESKNYTENRSNDTSECGDMGIYNKINNNNNNVTAAKQTAFRFAATAAIGMSDIFTVIVSIAILLYLSLLQYCI